MGIGYAQGNYGPDGIQGGSQCFYKYRFGVGTSTPGVDSAQENIVNSLTITVLPFVSDFAKAL
jgi:hypothetical protein